MSIASFLPAAARARRLRLALRRPAAWLLARARDPGTGLWLVITFALLHALIWTQTLIKLKAAQSATGKSKNQRPAIQPDSGGCLP